MQVQLSLTHTLTAGLQPIVTPGSQVAAASAEHFSDLCAEAPIDPLCVCVRSARLEAAQFTHQRSYQMLASCKQLAGANYENSASVNLLRKFQNHVCKATPVSVLISAAAGYLR